MPLYAVEIVAHRGSSDDAPENTVASAHLAWERKADAVELDIHLTKDGKLAVIHDDNTQRTTGVSGTISGMTLEEIQKLDAGSLKGPSYAGEKIPSLDQLLATGGKKGRFFIEIKGGPELIPELKACLERAQLTPDQAVMISFDCEAIKAAKASLPQYKALLLKGYDKNKQTGSYLSVEEVIAEAKAAHLDGLDLSSQWPLSADKVRQIKAAGLGLWVWTVDDEIQAKKCRDAGVDGITTNRPGWLRELLAR